MTFTIMNGDQTHSAMDEKLSDKEAYKTALATRNFEIGLFWKRSNYFLVLNTALAVGFFKIDDLGYSLLLSTLGFTVSVLWYRVNLGSKFWQSRWERRLRISEEHIAPEVKFFSANWETIYDDVKSSLQNGSHKGFQRYIDDQVLRKPSVSFQMITLSVIFIAAWTILVVTRVVLLIDFLWHHFGA